MNGSIIYYPLTHPQKGIWYTEKLYPGTSIGNIGFTLKIKYDIDIKSLEKAFNIFLQNNESMRIRITEIDNEPFQYISNYQYYNIEVLDFNNTEQLYKWDTVQTHTPFALLDSDLFYLAFVRTEDGVSGLYLKVHHLIGDAWSAVLLANELFRYYSQVKNGIEDIKSDTYSYVDYIKSEKEYLESERYIKDREFWAEKFGTVPELTMLKPYKDNEANIKSKRKTFILPKKLSLKLRQYCQENKASLIGFIMTSIANYINRVTGKEEIVFGTPILNRSNAREKNTLGMFVNTVPVRIRVDESLDYLNYSQYIMKEWMSVLKHQRYPYDYLLKDVRKIEKGVEKLYDILVSYQNAKLIKDNPDSYEGRWHSNGYQTESICIHINDREDDGNIIFNYDYLSNIFYSKEIDFIHDHITRLLWHALDNPLKKLPEIEMVSEKEKNLILNTFSGSAAEYDKNKNLKTLFEDQVAENGERIALIFKDQKVSYAELNKSANQVAKLLKEAGAGRNDIVGLIASRSMEMAVSVLGIIKAGAAYLPILPDLPQDRIDFLLQDCNCKVLLTNKDFSGQLFPHVKKINIRSEKLTGGHDVNPDNTNSPEDLAYIVYTSGTTGDPKGVMVEHRSVNNLIFCTAREICYKHKNVIAIASVSFDVFVLDFLLPLMTGGTVVLASDEEQKDNHKIAELIERHNVDIMHITPSRLQLFFSDTRLSESISRLSDLIIGGETPSAELLEQLLCLKGTKVYNAYGPTEATVQVTLKRIVDNNPLNIGRPLSNTKIYILDKHKNIVPIGVKGEIYIGGDCLARGYISSGELTDEKFILSPFNNKEMLYRTGDYGRWFSEGEIEFSGRTDNQVKISGYRIQLEEIEKALLSIDGIRDASVLPKSKNGRKYLYAYIVPESSISIISIKDSLAKKLPYYMIPSCFVRIDKMPLSQNGKVDKKQLELNEYKIETGNRYVRPRNKTEKILSECWKKVLGIERISIDDNYFELGADSMSVIQIQSLLYVNNLVLSTQDFYRYQTIRQMAEMINGKSAKMAKYELPEKLVIRNGTIRNDNICTDINCILITGATGFLGIHLLDEIYTRTNNTIYCLIRGDDHLSIEKRLYSNLKFYFGSKYSKENCSKRIKVVKGDVSLKHFGMNEDQYIKLATEIDAIIHCAAVVKHFGDFHEFNQVNINGTSEVIEMASRYGKLLFHISTASVLWLSDKNNISKQLINNFYIKSKLEAEHLVAKGIMLGLNANIIRVGNLTGRYYDGVFQKNIEKNAFYNRLKSFIEIGAIPDMKSKGLVEFTPVDYCSRAIIDIIYNKRDTGRIYNIYNNKYISMENLLEILKSLGYDIKVLNRASFENYLSNYAKHNNNNKKLNGIISELSNYNNLESILEINSPEEGCSLYPWPEISREYIKKLVGHMKKVKYLSS